MTVQDGIAHRSADIHWPDGLKPTEADLFAHNEIVIDAAPEHIWQHLIAATAWPTASPTGASCQMVLPASAGNFREATPEAARTARC